MILMNSPSARLRNGALLARSCWASTPHAISFETWPIIATSREYPGVGEQSCGCIPATQIMATMLKLMGSCSCWDLSAAKLGETPSFRSLLPPRRDPHQPADHVQGHAQAVGDHRVGAPGGGELGDKAAAVAHARAFDDDPGHDRPTHAGRLGPRLPSAGPEPAARCRPAAGRGAGRSRATR